MDLAFLACLHKVHGVLRHIWPVVPGSNEFSSQGFSSDMVATAAFVDFLQVVSSDIEKQSTSDVDIEGSLTVPWSKDWFPVPGLVLASFDRRSALAFCSLGTWDTITLLKVRHPSFGISTVAISARKSDIACALIAVLGRNWMLNWDNSTAQLSIRPARSGFWRILWMAWSV
ncbi:hypothetical protein PIB30_108293, partial [Stylosanthes scabra]|nr:hypothetical protein [Stylosanthes scabra]